MVIINLSVAFILLRHQGVDPIWRCHLTSIENTIVEIRQLCDRLISTMVFPIQVKWHLYIESGPSPLKFICQLLQCVPIFLNFLTDPRECFDLLFNTTLNTPSETYFLSILQHLLSIRDDEIARWVLVSTIAIYDLVRDCGISSLDFRFS